MENGSTYEGAELDAAEGAGPRAPEGVGPGVAEGVESLVVPDVATADSCNAESGAAELTRPERRRLARLARKQAAEVERRAADEAFMRLALEEARAAAAAGEVPIGAVVVHQPIDRGTGRPTAEAQVIARGHNLCETAKDASRHAEFSAMRDAEAALDNWRLTDCTVYVTLEPCIMCAGLMQQARVSRCVFGAPDPKGGALGSLYEIHQDKRLNHRFEVTPGILQEECQQLLQDFFQQRRK